MSRRNRRLNRTVGGLLLLGLLALPAAQAADAVPSVSPREAAVRTDWMIVDVREPYELGQELGHIEGAHNISLGRITVGKGLQHITDRSVPILMVCRTGVRAERAAARAREMGFTNVHTLAGGMVAWNEAGLKVVHPEPAEGSTPKVQLEIVGVPCG